MTIKKKIMFFSGSLFMILILTSFFLIWMFKFSIFDFKSILDKNVSTNGLVKNIKQEASAFENYMKNDKEENLEALNKAINNTCKIIQALPMEYSKELIDEYARAAQIKRAYAIYENKRDKFLENKKNDLYNVNDLYEIYDMQNYLTQYAVEFNNIAITNGNNIYENKISSILFVPYIFTIIIVILFLGLIYVAKAMNKSIVLPILKLCTASKKIADNEFYIDDIKVENKDELGELVHAFNKMKYATGVYIQALESQRETLELLHADEVEKLEMEKQLEAINLELLKNQIQPHFLFNTLNVISGMANLEDAKITEKMIKSLSNIFRYNLKTPETFVPLFKEIEVLEDYMYLQQMRFGQRVAYEINCEVDAESIIVPSFMLQPLCENAIIHGISPKEQGGKVLIHIWNNNDMLNISINDDGVGMDENELEDLNNKIKNKNIKSIGIGISNVYQRIIALYTNSSFEIFSRKDEGTLIEIKIPLNKDK